MPSKSEPRNKPLNVGITGGIGSGKTIVSKIFSLLDVPVYNADDRAKWLLANDAKVKEGLILLFGEKSFEKGALNREYIAKEVFNNKEKLEKLNNLVHPRVGEDYAEWVEEHRAYDYVLKEAALLYEAGSYKEMDKMITVYSPLELRIARLLKRDPFRTEEDIRKIIDKQWSDEEKAKRADHVIYNDPEHMLIPQVLKLDQLFRQ